MDHRFLNYFEKNEQHICELSDEKSNDISYENVEHNWHINKTTLDETLNEKICLFLNSDKDVRVKNVEVRDLLNKYKTTEEDMKNLKLVMKQELTAQNSSNVIYLWCSRNLCNLW